MVKAKLEDVAVSSEGDAFLVLLSTDKGAIVPIAIGGLEAMSIAAGRGKEKFPRPLTHDLFVNMLEVWGMTLERIIIHALQDNTFYALLIVRQGEVKKEIDSRPSDAIAIALRTNSPIWVMEEVIADASIPVDREADQAEQEAFREFLSNLRPEDLIQRGRFSGES